MMTGIREFLNTPAGKVVTVIMIVLGLGAVVWSFKANFGDTEVVASAKDRMFVCSETQKSFSHTLVIGEKVPVKSPYSGKDTGYPGEPCYWTKDGKVKEDPTWVILNEVMGKTGPTFCPDCGHLVVGHTPKPQPGSNPPPTASSYQAPKSEQ